MEISAEPNSKTRTAIQIGFFAARAANWEGVQNGPKACQGYEPSTTDVRTCKNGAERRRFELSTKETPTKFWHTRQTGLLPSKLRGLFFGEGNILVERQEIELPETSAGSSVRLELAFTTSEKPAHVQIDVLRPTLFSAYSVDWKP